MSDRNQIVLCVTFVAMVITMHTMNVLTDHWTEKAATDYDALRDEAFREAALLACMRTEKGLEMLKRGGDHLSDIETAIENAVAIRKPMTKKERAHE